MYSIQDNSTFITNEESLIANIHILPSQNIREYVEMGRIAAEEKISEAQIQPASIDLRLGSVIYELRSSFLPGDQSGMMEKISRSKLCLRQWELGEDDIVVLHPGCVYLVELMEQLNLPIGVSAVANPRSTTGRVDMFTRLLCDYSAAFDEIPSGYQGKLYAEIVPRTFSIGVRRGTRVNQLRFVVQANENGNHSNSNDFAHFAKHLCVDLTATDSSGIVGYRAKRNTPVFEFDAVAKYDRFEYWEPIVLGELRSLVLEPDIFYILRSRERVRIPRIVAAELKPYDPSFGEFRVHYAGFLDPGFGYGEGEVDGTPVVLEVRARDVPFLIEHGQSMARILYYSLLSKADKVYGSAIGSSYQHQGIALGKQFK